MAGPDPAAFTSALLQAPRNLTSRTGYVLYSKCACPEQQHGGTVKLRGASGGLGWGQAQGGFPCLPLGLESGRNGEALRVPRCPPGPGVNNYINLWFIFPVFLFAKISRYISIFLFLLLYYQKITLSFLKCSRLNCQFTKP